MSDMNDLSIRRRRNNKKGGILEEIEQVEREKDLRNATDPLIELLEYAAFTFLCILLLIYATWPLVPNILKYFDFL